MFVRHCLYKALPPLPEQISPGCFAIHLQPQLAALSNSVHNTNNSMATSMLWFSTAASRANTLLTDAESDHGQLHAGNTNTPEEGPLALLCQHQTACQSHSRLGNQLYAGHGPTYQLMFLAGNKPVV